MHFFVFILDFSVAEDSDQYLNSSLFSGSTFTEGNVSLVIRNLSSQMPQTIINVISVIHL